MKVDRLTSKMLQFFEENYTPVFERHLLNDESKEFLGEKANKKCRFCGKDELETTFKEDAHALPEFTGNKRLYTLYECDLCNHKFSRLLENQMANYMNLWHTFSQVRGKKGIPSFKTHKKKSRVDIGPENVEVENHEGDEIVTIDEEKKTISFTAKRATYVPIGIYKCLTKMALTVMPESDLQNFKTTMAWINEEDHATSPYDLKGLFAFFSLAPGAKPYPFTTCMLMKRKADAKQPVPYMIFLLAYGNFAFQIYLPLCSQDKIFADQNLNFTLLPFPTPIDMNEGAWVLARKTLDLNSKTPVKGEYETVTMQYESKTENEIKPNTNL